MMSLELASMNICSDLAKAGKWASHTSEISTMFKRC